MKTRHILERDPEFASPGMTTSPEFSWTYDLSRRCWVIRRRGTVYQVIPESRTYPAHSETYVRRIVNVLNGETP